MMHKKLLSGRAALAALLLASALTGCHRQQTVRAPLASAPSPHAAPILPVDLTKVQPNEAADVPILEYHDLKPGADVKDYAYPAAEFRRDTEWLYAHHYRPISLSDYARGRIDIPAGMSPVILTFDDALRGQFNDLPDGRTDPDCAVGILEDMHARHPDWPLKGTFFVLTDLDPKMPPPFYQKDTAQAKMAHLVQDGFEVGNHTVHHRMGMRRFPDAEVEAEFAGAVTGIHKYLPSYAVQTLALPYGVYPRHRRLVIGGESGGVSYHNVCALLAGANPAPSPMSQRFNPYRLPRIIPGNGRTRPGGLNTIRWWLGRMEQDRGAKFVSDGDPGTYTVAAADKGRLDAARLAQGLFHLRTYVGTKLLASR